MRHDWQQRVTQHLLGTLDARADGEVCAYLYSGDEETARRADEAREALEQLFERLEPCQPRDAVKADLLSRVAATPVESVPESQAVEGVHRLADHARGWLRIFEPSQRLGSLAAMIAVCAVSVAAVLINEQPARSPITHANQASPADSVQASTGDEELNELTSLVSLFQAYFEIIPLQSQTPQHARGGQLLWDRRHEVCYIFTPTLQPTGPDAVYHLWLTPPEADPVPVGQFDVDDSGRGRLRMDLPEQNVTFAKATISRSTNAAPTTPIEELLVGRLSH